MLLKFSPKIDHLKMVALTPVEGVALEKTLVQLLPGVNEVTDNEWSAMKPNISSELDSGEIIILAQKVSDGRGKPGGRKAKDLVEMPVNIAVNYIAECMNPETLSKWYQEETREEVRLAITKKMDKLGLEKPEDKIPDAPNASPMTFDEYESDEDDESYSDEIKEDDTIDLKSKKIEELKEMAKELNIEGFESMKKNELIEVLSNSI